LINQNKHTVLLFNKSTCSPVIFSEFKLTLSTHLEMDCTSSKNKTKKLSKPHS